MYTNFNNNLSSSLHNSQRQRLKCQITLIHHDLPSPIPFGHNNNIYIFMDFHSLLYITTINMPHTLIFITKYVTISTHLLHEHYSITFTQHLHTRPTPIFHNHNKKSSSFHFPYRTHNNNNQNT